MTSLLKRLMTLKSNWWEEIHLVKANRVKITVIKMMSKQDVFGDKLPTAVEESFEGSFPHIKDSKLSITCCTDGLRPVFFLLERMEE